MALRGNKALAKGATASLLSVSVCQMGVEISYKNVSKVVAW
jgi:hypothetical protein